MIRAGLERHVVGRTVADVQVLHPRVVRRDLEVTGVRGCPDGVEVVTPEGRQLFDRVVVSAGARVRGLLPWFPVTVSRQVLAWFEIDMSWLMIRFLQIIGLAKSVHIASSPLKAR